MIEARGEVMPAQDWFRPYTKPDGAQETAQEWANRVVNQGDLDVAAVALLGSYLYPEGTGQNKLVYVNNAGETVADLSEIQGGGKSGMSLAFSGLIPGDAPMSWEELATQELRERKIGEATILGAEMATTLVGTAGAFRAPMVARSVFVASTKLGRGAARGFRGLSRIPGMGALRSPGAQNFAAKGTDTVVQGSAEAAIDVLLGAAIPLEPIEAMTPERIGQLTAFEVGAEAATNLARFASGRFGWTGLGDVAKVGFEDLPLTGWGGRTGRTANRLH